MEFFPIFASSFNNSIMKSREFHRIIRKNGWVAFHQTGSHIMYAKEGYPNIPVPYHGSKEISEPLRRKLWKDMGL